MDFKNRPQPRRQPPRRVTLQDYTERSFRATSQPSQPVPVLPPAPRATDVVMPTAHVVAPKLAAQEKPVIPNQKIIDVVPAQPFARPARPKLQHSQVLARRAAAPKQMIPLTLEKPKRRSRAQTVLVAMAILVFGLGLLVNIETLQTNHNAKTQVAALSKKADTSSGETDSAVPSETKPPANSTSTYQVAPDAPKLITITKLGVKARVKPVGVTASNELGTPASIYDTGWYNASAKPGSGAGSGAMLIDGHVHGPTLPGVFVDIKKLVVGDTIQVTRGDNQVFSYIVMKTQSYDANTLDVGMLLTSIQPGKPALNLVTCGGPFDSKTQHYTERVVVFAVQQG